MGSIEVRIEEFPRNGRAWRIDGLGRIGYPVGIGTEPVIATHLSELHDDFTDPLSNGALTGRGFVAFIKIGQIALLKIGSVWVDGLRKPTKASRIEDFSVNPSMVTLHQFKSLVRIREVDLVPLAKSRFLVSPESWRGLADSWIAIYQGGYAGLAGLAFIAIPCAALFQKCVATSPSAVRRLAWGELNKIVDAPQWLEDEPGTYYVEVCKDIRDIEAPAHASLCADPSGLREYNRFRNALVTNSVNATAGASGRALATHIQFGVPFSNQVSMRAKGKYLRVHDAEGEPCWAFLATEIDSLRVKLVFDRLKAPRKNDGRKGANANSPELEDAWPSPGKRPSGVDDSDYLPLHSGDDPLTSLEALCLEAAGGFEAVDLEVVKDPKLLQSYASQKGRPGDGEFDGSLSTGDPHSGEEGAAELDIKTQETPKFPVTLAEFFATLNLLRNAGHRFETVAITNSHQADDAGDIVNFFPRVMKGLRSWNRVAPDPMAPPRGYVVATLKLGGVWHHFLELERKGTEAHALLHLRCVDGEPIDAANLRAYMTHVAKKNGWTSQGARPNWVLEGINHSLKFGRIRLASTIASALGLQFEAPAASPIALASGKQSVTTTSPPVTITS